MPQPSVLISAVRSWHARNELAGTVALNGVIAAAAWVLAELVLVPVIGGRTVTPMWPPAGLAVAVTYLGGYRLLPGIVVASVIGGIARNPWPLAVALSAVQVIQPLVDVLILRALRFDARFHRARDPIILCIVAGVGALAAATASVGLLSLAGRIAGDRVAYELVSWALRDWLGVMVMAPVIFAWGHGRPLAWTWARRSTTLVALLAAVALYVAGAHPGPFANYPAEFTQFVLFLLLALASLGGLLLAAIMTEREEATARRLLLEEQLRHAQKMEAVGRLAGGIAHDFNNLLTAIIGYSEIVLHSLDPKDERRADAEEIGRAAMRAADLTRQMLAFSRRQVLQRTVIDLNTALSKVEPMLRRVIGEDISMSVTARATGAYVRVDPGQVEQVVMNLVVNARDAMPKGGRLAVETNDVMADDASIAGFADAGPGSYVLLSVSDTGTGMAPEVRERMFEPYFTTKEMGKGTGLGLSTVYGIVRQSDGHIVVQSEVGRGSTFKIYLPRTEAPKPVRVDPSGERMPEGTEHILLVEDDPSVRRLSKELLLRLGYSVTEAASGRAGLALGSDDTRHFDLALCDVILGDMSGPAVAEALTALRPSTRVLYMSGYMDEAIVRTGVLEEGKPFLQKPFTPLQLSKKIREVLDEPENSSL
ncbi:MAG TPA: ATP-binding protein [Vicinamibacterales bacterium]|nr:ATP-binding protein [Vicinamibacterales bacterium]